MTSDRWRIWTDHDGVMTESVPHFLMPLRWKNLKMRICENATVSSASTYGKARRTLPPKARATRAIPGVSSKGNKKRRPRKLSRAPLIPLVPPWSNCDLRYREWSNSVGPVQLGKSPMQAWLRDHDGVSSAFSHAAPVEKPEDENMRKCGTDPITTP